MSEIYKSVKRRGKRLPKTPKWVQDNPLFRPSLSTIIRDEDNEEAMVEKTWVEARKSRNKKNCEDCLFDRTHNGSCLSIICRNTPSRPRFLAKGELDIS